MKWCDLIISYPTVVVIICRFYSSSTSSGRVWGEPFSISPTYDVQFYSEYKINNYFKKRYGFTILQVLLGFQMLPFCLLHTHCYDVSFQHLMPLHGSHLSTLVYPLLHLQTKERSSLKTLLRQHYMAMKKISSTHTFSTQQVNKKRKRQ